MKKTENKITYRILSVCFFLLYAVCSFAQPRTVNVNVNFKIEEGDYAKSYLVQENTTTGEKQTIAGQSKYSLNLKYNSDYILSFNKPGYITKKIEINTSAPADRIEQNFYPIQMAVILIKQYDGVNIVVFNQPVSKYTYSKVTDDFDYDTDYTKQIQAALKEAENEIEKKKKEEKLISAANAKSAEIAKQDSIVKVKAEAKAKLEEDQRLKAEAKAKEDSDAKAKSDSSMQVKKNLANKTEEDKRQQAKAKMEEDERKKAAAKSDADERAKAAKAQQEEDVRKKAEAKAEEDAKRKLLANANSGSDAKKNTIGTEGTDLKNKQDAKPMEGNDSRTLEKSDELPANVNVEEIIESNRAITKATVTKNNRETVFLKIVYKWGGVYFFQGDMPISQNSFQLATNLK